MAKLTRRSILAMATAALAATPDIPLHVNAETLRRKRINVMDFGATADGTRDSGPALARAIAACPEYGAVLTFPHGQYRFDVTRGNAIDIQARRNIEIDGGHSDFRFNGNACGFSFTNVEGVNLHSLSLDWSPPPFSQGKVVDLSSDEKVLYVAVDGIYPVNYDVYAVRIFDKVNLSPHKAAVAADNPPRPRAVNSAGNRIVRLEFDSPVAVPGDSIIVLLHNRQSFGLIFGQSADVHLQDVHLHTAPGFAIAGTGTTDFAINRCSIAPQKGSNHVVSSTADGIHFWGSRGKFKINDVQFVGLCDDCVNVHGFFLDITPTPAATFLVLAGQKRTKGQSQQVSSPMLPAPGDRYTIVDANSFQPLARGQIRSITTYGSNFKVDCSDLVNTVGHNTLFIDEDQLPALEVRNCAFTRSSGCGVVAHANATIEANQFVHMGWAGVNCQVNATWLEGPLVSNISIRRNTFFRCGLLNRLSIVIHTLVHGKNGAQEANGTRLNHNVVIDENIFREPVGTTVFVGETRTLTITKNIFISNIDPTELAESKVSIFLYSVSNVIVSGNSSDVDKHVLATKTDKAEISFMNNERLSILFS